MKKLRTLQFAAVAAIMAAAFAAPAVASAAHWFNAKTGQNLKSPATIGLEGEIQFDVAGSGSGFRCPSSSEATLTPGSEGTFTKFSLNKSMCVGFGAAYENCVVNSTETKLPSLKATEAGTILVNNLYIKLGIEKCKTGTPWMSVEGNVTATPDNKYEISSLALKGNVTWKRALEFTSTALVQAWWSVTPAGEYGIAPE